MFQILRTFISVYETHNFTRTADSLFLSQPTVSSQIKKLEDHLNTKLFIRNGKQEIVPTQAAEFLYPRIIKMIEEWEDVVLHIGNDPDIRETCVIACTKTCGIHLLAQIVPSLIETFPMVDFHFPILGYQEIVHGVEQAKFDFGLIEWAERSEHLNRYLLVHDELVVAGDSSSNYWILNENINPLRELNDLYLRKKNLTPTIIQTNSNEMIEKLINNGAGRSILSKRVLTDNIPYETLNFENSRNFYFLTREEIIPDLFQEVAMFIRTALEEKD